MRRDADTGGDRGRRQGRRPRRRRRRPRGGGRRGDLGGLQQRRPDLHRRGAGLRARTRLRRLPRADPRQGQGPARRRRAGLEDRADHDAQAAGRDPLAHRRRHRQGRQGGARRSGRRRRALRAADDPGRRTRGLRGRAGGDLRTDRDRHPGARHGRGRRAHQRHALRPRLHRLRPGTRHGDRGADPVRHDRGQRRDHVRGDPLPAVRRRGRLRLRPDPRGRRAPGVQLRARDRTAAVQADDEPHLVHAHGEAGQAAHPSGQAAARPRLEEEDR